MTTLERLAKAAFESMLSRHSARGVKFPPNWEGESQQLRDDWMTSTRAVVEGLKKPTDDITMAVMRRTSIMFGNAERLKCEFIFVAMINAVLEEKS